MRLCSRTFALVAAFLSGTLTLNPAAALDGTLLVVNREDVAGSISFFDLPTQREIARVPIGPGWPHEVATSPDGRLALTAEYGLDAPGRRVVVIDVRRAQVVGYIDTGPGSKPHDSVFLPDNRHAVVTLETTDELALLDVEELALVRRISIGDGAREGHMIALDSQRERVYVGGRSGGGTVSAVPLDPAEPPDVIPTAAGAEAIAVVPGGDVWVLNQDANSISVIDPVTLRIRETFASATQPRRLAILPRDRIAVINGNADTSGIRVYDIATRDVLDELEVPGAGVGAGGFGFLVIESSVFVSTRADGRILLYDLSQPELPPVTFATSHETPDGMAWSPLRVEVLAPR
jgi:YVTN family beta-propeller protein